MDPFRVAFESEGVFQALGTSQTFYLQGPGTYSEIVNEDWELLLRKAGERVWDKRNRKTTSYKIDHCPLYLAVKLY
jgi:hypothetical protein